MTARRVTVADLLGDGPDSPTDVPGRPVPVVPVVPADGHPPRAAGGGAATGARELTGRPDGPPLLPAGDPAGAAQHLIDVWRSATGVEGDEVSVGVLGERAALAGFGRGGDVTCGGAGRLLPAADGWVALSLARPDDLASVPALVQEPVDDPWTAVTAWLGEHAAAPAVERARLLGLAAAVVPDGVAPGRRPGLVAVPGGDREQGPGPGGGGADGRVAPGGPPAADAGRGRRVRVLDLTSLWAGPLAGHLLQLAGADVVKLESILRPDGARRGTLGFFHLLHAGKRSAAFDFEQDGALLRRLVRAADVVLESSRPRALAQHGVDAEAEVARGAIWASITAYGREGEAGLRVGFGDDVAAGAGLVARDAAGPVFCGDAIADPLAGLAAAAAVARALHSPIGVLLDVSMHDVARIAASLPPPVHRPADAARPADGAATADARPRLRRPRGIAPALGAQTDEVVREWLG